MRVLFVSQEFPPETGWGGIGTYAATITRALARAGAEVHVLSVVQDQQRSERSIDGVHVHRAPTRRLRGIGRVTHMPETWKRLALAASVALERRRLGAFDVCEAPEWYAESLGLALARPLPLVVRVHSGGRQMFPFLGRVGRDRRFAVALEEAAIRRADVVTGTASLTRQLVPILGLTTDRVRPIICPVDPVDPLPDPPDEPRVAFVGRFERRKGADVLVRAMPRVLERVPQARLVMRGRDTRSAEGGSVLAELRGIAASLGVADRIDFKEEWSPEAVAEELTDAHVCAVPSRWESFGLVAAEAAMLGRPVVASRIPGLDEVIVDGATGRLVEPDDPGALGEAVGDLLLDPTYARRLGSAAARDLAKRCDPDRVAAATLDAYAAAIDLHHGGRP